MTMLTPNVTPQGHWILSGCGRSFTDRKSTRLNSSHVLISYAVFCLKKKIFSLSITLSMAGVKVTDLRHADLRPSALRRTYYETTGRIVKYYDNIRFVYEIELRLRRFKRATTPAQPAPEKKEKERKNNTSGQPEQKQERNYSQWENHPVLAAVPDQPPVVSVTTTYRRNS